MTPANLPTAPSGPRWLRGLFALAGGLALLAGVIGIFLPVLPTTPFILLAALCFARSSPRIYGWLLNHRLFGPMIDTWQRHRSIPRRVRWIALASMGFSISLSIMLMQGQPWLQLALGLLGVVLAAGLLRVACTRKHAIRPCADASRHGIPRREAGLLPDAP